MVRSLTDDVSPAAGGADWSRDVRAALRGHAGSREAERLVDRYLGRFPPGYAATTAPWAAAADIAALESISAPECPEVVMALRAGAGPDERLLRFHLYRRGSGVALSAFVPILESLGLTVIEEIPTRLDAGEAGPVLHIHDFGVAPDGVPVDVGRDGPRIAAAAQAVWQGRVQADRLNRLVAAAGLAWNDVAILRAYRRYRLQVGKAFS